MCGTVRRRVGYTLLLVLGFVAAFLALMIGWIWQSQSLGMILRRSQALAQRQNTSMDTTARMGIALSHSQLPTAVGNVSLAQNFTSSPPEGSSSATVTWGEHSLRYPLAQSPTCWDNLFGGGVEAHAPNSDFVPKDNKFGHLPLAGYDAELIQHNSDQIPLAPGHVLMKAQGMGGPEHVAVFDTAFPYAVYAPEGSIQIDTCWAWHNPPMPEEQEPEPANPDYPYASGLPVLVRAKGQVRILKDFPCGIAYSEDGPIYVPKNCAGLAFSGPQPQDQFCANLTAQAADAFNRLSKDAVDKNRWIRGKGLTLDGFRRLLTEGDWTPFLTVQQACAFPIPMFPTFQSEPPFVEILTIHHPLPADFTGDTPVGKEDIDELKKLDEEMKEIREELEEREKEVKKCEQKVKELESEIDPKRQDQQELRDKLDEAREELQQAKLKEENTKQELEEKSARAKEIGDDLKRQRSELGGNSDTAGKIPQNAWQDETQPRGSGWAYVNMIKNLTRGLGSAVKGEGSSALDGLQSSVESQVRLVHFGSMSPGWEYLPEGYTIKGTVNVPPGKTLKLGGGLSSTRGDKNVAIQGDLWIQRGAVCYVDGNLTISKPEEWEDFKDVKVSTDVVDPEGDDLEPGEVPVKESDGTVNFFFPWGRIFLEEGATLAVSGNLKVSGGCPETGSVVVCSKIGGNRPISTGILCKGNVELAHGIYSGVTMQDLIDHFCVGGSSTLRGFYEDFLNPLLGGVASNLCKVLGPFNERESYFAKYATTFLFLDFLAEFGLAEVPWPIPLPIDNKDRVIFEWISIVYAYELNFTLGENFYTQCSWWLLGRGAVPAFLKVPPKGLDEAFRNIDYGKIVLDTVADTFKKVIVEVIPDILKSVVKGFVAEVVTQIIKDSVPWSIPGEIELTGKQKYGQELKKKLKEALKKLVQGKVKLQAKEAAMRTIVKIKNLIFSEGGGRLNATALLHEVPGVFVYSGKDMQIGKLGDKDSALTALGLIYAEGNLSIYAQKIVGSLISRHGKVRSSGDVLFYPYFTQVSLYEPLKSPWDAFKLTVPNPGRNTAIDLSFPRARVTASGYLR